MAAKKASTPAAKTAPDAANPAPQTAPATKSRASASGKSNGKTPASGKSAASGKTPASGKSAASGKSTASGKASANRKSNGKTPANGKAAAPARRTANGAANAAGNGRPAAPRRSNGGGKAAPINAAGKDLVIVESPAKARTVAQILGSDYVVTASQGHLRDLPKSKIGVDVAQDFEPSYVIMQDKRSLLSQLKKAGDAANQIYLATDPDREGEAISWHLQQAADWGRRAAPPKRVVFHEITREAVEEAFSHPREVDMQLVNAQQARRILDRLVGYQISPLLWRRVQRGLSAGRVQSVSLRMVVDREREIQQFVPVESWTLDALLRKEDAATAAFPAALHSVKGQRQRLNIAHETDARRYEQELTGAAYRVAAVSKRDVRQRPAAPFTTSTMQQDAGRKLRFTAQRTMSIAQQLYEGVDLGQQGSVGLITYMRTDSTQVAASAVAEVREYIGARYGKDHLPDKPRVYSRRSKAAQEAHEAIRPTSIRRDPASLRGALSREQLNLYTLIWERMLASQMADAISEATSVDIDATARESGQVYNFRATGSVLKFAGFRSVYLEGRDDAASDNGNGGGGNGNNGNADADSGRTLPPLAEGDALHCDRLDANQHFTEPPPRYTEATLIRAMEERGIGRPSTYAPTIGILVSREYVERGERSRLTPTNLGLMVTDLLTEHFAEVMDLEFTARMEGDLDEVARGEREWVPVLRDFYDPFNEAVKKANDSFTRDQETDEVCDKCGQPMVMKSGRFGRFLACSAYPGCRNTKDAGDNLGQPFEEETDEICEKCQRPMVVKAGRYGRFLACSGYGAEENPCDNRRNLLNKTGINCPRCSVGELVERKARGRGRAFWGCSRYPDCDFLVNQRPLPTPCPECSGLMVQKGRNITACTNCTWQEAVQPETGEAAAVAR